MLSSFLLTLLTAGAAPIETATHSLKPVDVSALMESFELYSAGDQLFAFGDKSKRKAGGGEPYYIKQGPYFFEIRTGSSWTVREGVFEVEIRDPRFRERKTLIRRDSEGYSIVCGGSETRLVKVPPEKQIPLKAEAFVRAQFKWVPHFLARDTQGTYYYIDRAPKAHRDDPVREARVFKGPKGKMKRLKMKAVVEDSLGDIFSTVDGKLRLVRTSSKDLESALWVQGKNKEDLLVVPVHDNEHIIFSDLGIYDGMPLGMPCDTL